MDFPPIIIYSIILIIILFFNQEHMSLFNSHIGKLSLLIFIFLSTLYFGTICGILSSIICIYLLHNNYEGFGMNFEIFSGRNINQGKNKNNKNKNKNSIKNNTSNDKKSNDVKSKNKSKKNIDDNTDDSDIDD
jgi:hypothetical protein